MQQNYARFTKEMKNTHTILIPNMAQIHFRLIEGAFIDEGYKVKVLSNRGESVAQEGLKYVHNDTCYPALLVIGQFIDALKSGEFDVDKTALLLTQTGGGCRASNYIHLLRKALEKAGFAQVPVVSINYSGLEKDNGFKLNLTLIKKTIAGIFYGDMLMALSNQTRPYENNKGDTQKLIDKWVGNITRMFSAKKGVSQGDMKKNFNAIAKDFANLQTTHTPKIKVGVVGEIYVKYSPLGNNDLEKFLQSQDCEVNVPGLMGFLQYCVANYEETIKIYGGSFFVKTTAKLILAYLDKTERIMCKAIEKYNNLHAPTPFYKLRSMADGIIGRGVKMGEGWLLTAEMMELQSIGFENIICTQPFGCLPNHICGKGMINKIRTVYPNANITPIDYDPGATRVNQENRIKLMLSMAKERLDNTNGKNGKGEKEVENSYNPFHEKQKKRQTIKLR